MERTSANPEDVLESRITICGRTSLRVLERSDATTLVAAHVGDSSSKKGLSLTAFNSSV